MASTDKDYDKLLHASERFRNANDDMIWYIESGNYDQLTHDKVWQQMEKAREELWALRSSHAAKARRKNNNSSK